MSALINAQTFQFKVSSSNEKKTVELKLFMQTKQDTLMNMMQRDPKLTQQIIKSH